MWSRERLTRRNTKLEKMKNSRFPVEVLERKKKNLRSIVDEKLTVEAKRLGMKLSCKAPLLGSGNPSMRDKLLIVSPCTASFSSYPPQMCAIEFFHT